MFLKSLLFFSICFSLEAKLVQILHTNDIHGHFDHIRHDESRGGYANLKATIDELKDEAFYEGIPSLVVDAGDFMEGHSYYMADEGRKTLQMHNAIGYDVAVIGNHDFLMGTDSLEEILGDTPLNFHYVGANVYVDDRYKNIKKVLKPYKEFVIDGVKIAFLGLATNEWVYAWRLYEGKIKKPWRESKKYQKELKERGNDFVIALTHLGLAKDEKLVKKSTDIDLVVGGHSHDALFSPIYKKNKKKTLVPIVQAGEHGQYVGKLIVDFEKGKPLKIVDYKLVPIMDRPDKNKKVHKLAKEAKKDLEKLYGKDYLYEVLGQSLLAKRDDFHKLLWSFYNADSIREEIKTDFAVHQSDLSGSNYPIGDVNRLDIMNAHPRWFDFRDIYGWSIYRANVSGWLVKLVLKVLIKFNVDLAFSGINFDYKIKKDGDVKIKNIKIGGEKIKLFKKYSLALPEGIARGGLAITNLVSIILKNMHKTPYVHFEAIENKLRREKVITPDYLDRSNQKHQKSFGLPLERVFVPARRN